ncbi:hypothetical protein JYT83_00605 [bacterium AH-315-F18]|nr:hypothetical protein [bacterium AH-315-F18]
MIRLLALLILAALPVLAAPPVTHIESFDFSLRGDFGDLARFSLNGKTKLPDGTKLLVRLAHRGGTPQKKHCIVQLGAFDFTWSTTRKVLAGPYTADVYHGDQVVAHADFTVGDEAQVTIDAQRFHEEMLALLRLQRTAYRGMVRWYTFEIRNLDAALKTHGGKLPEEIKTKTLLDVRRYTEFEWASRCTGARYEYQKLRAEIPLYPSAALDRHFHAFIALQARVYAISMQQVMQRLGEPLPSGVPDAGKVGWDATLQEMDANAEAIKKLLKAPQFTWKLEDLGNIESGWLLDGEYHSMVSGFKIALPDPRWKFQPVSTNPVVRLSMIRDNADGKQVAYARIKPREFLRALDLEDLEKQFLISLGIFWERYTRHWGKPITVKDGTLPGGTRRGYDLFFSAQMNNGQMMEIRERALYSRDHKVCHSLLIMVKPGQFKKFEVEIEKLCKSFAIFDAPDQNLDALAKGLKARGAVPFPPK